MGNGLWCPWCGSGNYSVNHGAEPPWFKCTDCSFEGPESTCIHSDEPPRRLQEESGLRKLAEREAMR